MSSSELCDRVEEINSHGLDTGRFIAIGDAWHGPIKEASGISFYAEHMETIPAAWQIEYARERGHE